MGNKSRYWIRSKYYCQKVTRRQILDSSKLIEFADDNFKFNKNGIKLSKQVENIVGKEEIARNEQFLLSPQCFQKACFPGASKGVIVWEWVKQNFTYHIDAVIVDMYKIVIILCRISSLLKGFKFKRM